MEIEKHSRTWRAVEAFIAREKDDAIKFLIADMKSEQQRGVLLVLEKLEKLADEPEEEQRFWESA